MIPWIDEAAVAIDSAMCVLIWLVQIIIYPAFRHIDRSRFVEWHRGYMAAICFFVVPLMFAQVGIAAWLLWVDPSAWRWLAAAGIAVAWALTAIGAEPAHRALTKGFDEKPLRSLLAYNWGRTVAWTITLIAALSDQLGG